MSIAYRRLAAGLAGAGFVALAAPAIAQNAAEAPVVVQSITACRQIVDEAERFACYDRVAGAIGKGESAINQAAQPPTPAQRQETERREFGRPAAPPPIVRKPEPPKQAARAKPKRADQVVSKLEHISKIPDGRLLIVTTDGGTWVQTDHERFQNLPRRGDEIMLRRGPLGNFLCDLDRWHAARCRRLD